MELDLENGGGRSLCRTRRMVAPEDTQDLADRG